MREITDNLLEEITVGSHIRLVSRGVPEWNIPELQQDVVVTDDNLGYVILDCAEDVEHGGAKVYKAGL